MCVCVCVYGVLGLLGDALKEAGIIDNSTTVGMCHTLLKPPSIISIRIFALFLVLRSQNYTWDRICNQILSTVETFPGC